MIRIFNIKNNTEIIIDDSVDWVQFTPKDYDEKPHVTIELKGFNLFQHSQHCNDCKNFINSFGKDSIEWLISYSNKVFRLDTKQIGQKQYGANEIKTSISEFENVTKMTLAFHDIPTDNKKLEILLNEAVELENYEKACIIRDAKNQNIWERS